MTDEHAEVEAEPSQHLLHGEALLTVRRFAADLAEYGEVLGLVGPREYERLWTRHLLNSAAIGPLFQGMRRIGDVGSGAGFPGIVLAALLPDVECNLIEPMARRARWLSEESQRLGLSNVLVHARPAQEVPLRGQLDGVTSRAVAPLKKLIPMTAPLVHSGGSLVLIKGRSVSDELEAAKQQVNKAQLADITIREMGVGEVVGPTTVLVATVKGHVSRGTFVIR